MLSSLQFQAFAHTITLNKTIKAVLLFLNIHLLLSFTLNQTRLRSTGFKTVPSNTIFLFSSDHRSLRIYALLNGDLARGKGGLSCSF